MWVCAIWMLLCFYFAPDQYQELKAMGEPCMIYVTALGPYDGSAQPGCFYDPTNINSGVPK